MRISVYHLRPFLRWAGKGWFLFQLVCLIIIELTLLGSPTDAIATEIEQYHVPPNYRVVKTIDREWTFNYFPAENADTTGCQAPDFDDSTWPAVAIPHTWQTYETTGKVHPFIYDADEKKDPYWWYGWGWYRKHFFVGKEETGRRVFVEFDGVQKYSKIWVNGKFIGDHKGGYTSFYFDITDALHFGADNVLAVAVNNRQDDPFKIPPMSAGNFDVYGGIYRDVRIVIKDPLHIPFQGSYRNEGGTFVTTPEVSEQSGVAEIKTWVRNDSAIQQECELRTTLVDADDQVVQVLRETKTIQPNKLVEFDQLSQPVMQPHLWSPDHPYCYKVFSDVCSDGRVVDHYESPLGFRWFKWDYTDNRLVLNGKKVVIRGTNRHQEWPWLGDATPKWLHLQDMKSIRYDLNDNFMRTAHYPQDPAIYNFCDYNGIIVIEETPNIKDQNFSKEVQIQQLREMIRRDRNHPSIFFWSMGNETDHAVDSKYAVQEDTNRIIYARQIYNDSAGKYVTLTDKQLAIESLLRCTIRGWYDSDVRDLEPKSVQQAGTETWQHDQAAAALIKLNQGHAPGDWANLNTFLYEDHGADREYVNCPLLYDNPKGWVDCWRAPKYMYYLWQAFYARKPMVFVQPHYWRSQYVGQKKEIVVDSNCETVELDVNGRSMGVKEPQFDEANVVRFEDVPIEEGVLTAIGSKNGQSVTDMVVMAAAPARLTLSANPESIEAALNSVAIIRADIVDDRGIHVYGATNTIYWSVTGPATLVGAPVYQTDIAQDGANGGTMYIDTPTFNIIRATDKPGKITVSVRSPGLSSAEVVINADTPPTDGMTAIMEPPLPDTDRRPVAREGRAPQPIAVADPEMHGVTEDITIGANNSEEYARSIDRFLREENRGEDFSGPEYQAVVSVFTRLLQNNHGNLARDDFNFTAGIYNNCRRITQQIDTHKLPPLFVQSLREYYAHAMIERGEAKDYNKETAWLKSLPEGKLVMAGVPADAAHDPDVLYATKPNLEDMVALVLRSFAQLSASQKSAWLDAICAINPNVKRKVTRFGGEKVDGVRQKVVKTVSYEAVKGQPILIPDARYLQAVSINRKNSADDKTTIELDSKTVQQASN